MTVEERVKGRQIGILGIARSGIAAAKLAIRMGGKPFLSDLAESHLIAEDCHKLQTAGIAYETGGHTLKLLECDYLVISPGIPLEIEIIQKAKEKGLPVFSEVEFASWLCPGIMIAITGSNGKTTTAILIGEILEAAGKDSYVCGNIGEPLSKYVSQMNSDSIAVIEVSSFQLEAISEFRPDIAVILNLTPDHLDRHRNFENYRKAKYRLTENQQPSDLLLLNSDDPETQATPPVTKAEQGWFTVKNNNDCLAYVENDQLFVNNAGERQKIINSNKIKIRGLHNLQNAEAAAAVASRLGVESKIISHTLEQFAGVEHRLEFVRSVAGIDFINDSKATNVDSVLVALRSIETPIYLICGGRDKGGEFSEIANLGGGKIKSVIAIGEASHLIMTALGKSFPFQQAISMEDAVGLAFENAHPGETVLLSPGCASFDMFTNYEERGRAFKMAVERLTNGKNSDNKVSK